MKLRLDPTESTPTLVVSEALAASDVAVLRAGIRKLFKTGKKEVLLDLTGLPEAALGAEGVAQALKSLQLVATEESALLIVVSPVAGVGTIPARADAQAVLGSPLARLLNREAQLKTSVEVLEAEKKSAEAKLAAIDAQGNALAAKKENSELKARIRRLTAELETWLDAREKSPPRKTAVDPKPVLQTIQAVFKQQGLLK